MAVKYDKMTYRTDIDLLSRAKAIPIETILGLAVSSDVLRGRLKKYSSPFSSDSTPSFTIYPGNTFYDFSTGLYGDGIALVMKLGNLSFSEALLKLSNETPITLPALPEFKKDSFELSKYLTGQASEHRAIRKYANSRGIQYKYVFGLFYTKDNDEWVRHPSIGFIHVDYNLNVIGIKLRVLPDDPYRTRFSARGKLGLYICENILNNSYLDTTLYVVESESSANSLWEYCKANHINAVVVSGGGVAEAPKFIPKEYEKYEIKIIIDYDDSESLYQKRCKMYDHLNGEYIKLLLPKGEDINSLWSQGKGDLIKNLIL